MDKFVSKSIVFKECLVCGFEWSSREDFLGDPAIEIIGYQANFEELTLGILLFNHSCRGTLSIPAGDFIDLYDGQIFSERVTGSEECSGYCLVQEQLLPCAAQCECAYIREIIQLIKNWTKS